MTMDQKKSPMAIATGLFYGLLMLLNANGIV
jgi:hypothetical protein